MRTQSERQKPGAGRCRLRRAAGAVAAQGRPPPGPLSAAALCSGQGRFSWVWPRGKDKAFIPPLPLFHFASKSSAVKCKSSAQPLLLWRSATRIQATICTFAGVINLLLLSAGEGSFAALWLKSSFVQILLPSPLPLAPHLTGFPGTWARAEKRSLFDLSTEGFFVCVFIFSLHLLRSEGERLHLYVNISRHPD